MKMRLTDTAAPERTGDGWLISERGKALILLFGSTIFLSAFLLFQVQPIVGKMLLPWFGGSAAVWSTCLLFFQALLLLGYLYAHWTTRFLAPRNQALLHILLLAVSLAVLPITLDPAWKPGGGEDPTIRIIGLMTLAIGLPYFLLSTSGPLLQAWFAQEKPGAVPYRLFALSNLGSMLGLLSYPLLVEPRLSIARISLVWSLAYGLYALLCAMLAWRAVNGARAPSAHARINAAQAPSAGTLALWVALAACPAVLLMAITSHLTQNVAPVPFLWVLPLALYLLSFILCFEGGNWYRRAWYLPFFILWLAFANYDLVKPFSDHGVWLPIGLYCTGLFASCMLCHGELARRKPHSDYLTSFYLMIALGGAAGGLLVAVVAPRLFNNNWELPIASVVTALLIVTLVHRDAADGQPRISGSRAWLSATAVLVALVAIFTTVGTASQSTARRVMARNFYGVLTVVDAYEGGGMQRQLMHGIILHGSQYLDPTRRRWPTTYYGDNSGAGMAVLATRHDGQPQRVGVIGLGAGTMAAYGRAGDNYRFYEINPLVLRLARTQFSFLPDSPATIETVLGDARLSLEREPPQQFDTLVVDAFSGDSIPVHLLTREAFAIYFRHMKPGGILAVHISNRNLDLAPVVKLASNYYGKQARLVDSDGEDSRGLNGSAWVLISDRADIFDSKELQHAVSTLDDTATLRPWTDDYSSIYTILK